MKSSKRLFCTVLSVGIIASSIIPGFALENKASIQGTFIADSKSVPEKSLKKAVETPEKIVEHYYLEESKVKNKEKKQFKKNGQFKNSQGRTVVKTIQTYNGIPIYGTEQNYHVNKNGDIEFINGNNVEDIGSKLASSTIPTQSSIESILAVIEKDLGINPVYIDVPQSQLVLFPAKDQFVYAYKVNIKYNQPRPNNCIYYIDANNFSVLRIDKLIAALDEPVVGTGIGQSGQLIQGLKMVRNNGTYYLNNTVDNILTKNAAGFELFSEPDSCFDSGTEVNRQEDAVDAHNNVTKVTEYFEGAPFYRDSMDDQGSPINVLVDTTSNSLNAYGTTNQLTFLTGRGLAGKSVTYALDAVAHEFTHGMLTSEGLCYADNQENYSLHEGLADIFGTICEYKLPNEGSFDWTIAEDTGTILRDASNPKIDDYNDYIAALTIVNADYRDDITLLSPYEGSGVITKAAYLIAEGGTHNNITVDALGYDKLATIFYHAINDGYILPNMTFKQFASAAIQSAKFIYGVSSTESASVRKSFYAVGLGLNIADQQGTGAILEWTGATGAVTYGIYRRRSGSTSEPEKFTETQQRSIIVTVPLESSYDFFVAIVDSNGNRISEFTNSITIDRCTSNPITDFRITARGGLLIGLAWTGVPGGTYGIYRKATEAEASEAVKIAETQNSAINVGTLIGTYDFFAVTLDSSGYRNSTLGPAITVLTLNSSPANFSVLSTNDLQVNLGWTGESGKRYGIYRKATELTSNPVKIAETQNSQITVDTLNGSFDFYVAEIDSSGYRISSFSDAQTVESFLNPLTLSIKDSDSEKVTVEWNAASTKRVKLYRRITGSSDQLEVVNTILGWDGGFPIYFAEESYDYYVALVDFYGCRISYLSNPITVASQV